MRATFHLPCEEVLARDTLEGALRSASEGTQLAVEVQLKEKDDLAALRRSAT